jgi:hypothetical protein
MSHDVSNRLPNPKAISRGSGCGLDPRYLVGSNLNGFGYTCGSFSSFLADRLMWSLLVCVEGRISIVTKYWQ